MSERIRFNPEEEDKQPEPERYVPLSVFRRFMGKSFGKAEGDDLYFDPEQGTLINYRGGKKTDMSRSLDELLPPEDEE